MSYLGKALFATLDCISFSLTALQFCFTLNHRRFNDRQSLGARTAPAIKIKNTKKILLPERTGNFQVVDCETCEYHTFGKLQRRWNWSTFMLLSASRVDFFSSGILRPIISLRLHQLINFSSHADSSIGGSTTSVFCFWPVILCFGFLVLRTAYGKKLC